MKKAVKIIFMEVKAEEWIMKKQRFSITEKNKLGICY